MLAIPLIVGSIKAQQATNQTAQQGAAATETPQAQGQFSGRQGGFQQAQPTEEVNPGISALGSVAASTTVSLTFETSGTVKGVYVNPGDYVKAGDVLADLDETDALNSLNQANLNLQKAQLALNELYQPPTADDIKTAQANVASAQAAYNAAATAVTSATIQQDQLKYQQAEDQLTALQQARANMSGTPDEISLQEAKIGAASFNAEIARLQLAAAQTPDSASLWQASIRITQAQLNLDKLMAGPTQQQVDSATVALQRAQAAVLDAQTTMENIQLVAPSDGVVTAVNIAAGDNAGGQAAAGSAAVEISDLAHLQITVPVNELDVNKVKVGQSATVTLDALPGVNFPGTVQQISWLSQTSSDGIVTYNVQIGLNTNDPRVRIGMTGEVTINTESAA